MEILHTTGCVFEYPTSMPGLARLLHCPKEMEHDLLSMPGVMNIKQDSRGTKSGQYIPFRLFKIGVKPGDLFAYPLDNVETTPTGLKLRDHQRRAVTYIRNVSLDDQGCILGADPGCGKTIAALQALWLDGYLHKPGIVIGPMGARGTWTGERSDPFVYYGLNIIPLEGTKPNLSVLDQSNWFFIHYELIPHWQCVLFGRISPKCVVIDESHYIMKASSKRGRAGRVIACATSVERRVLLSGTPIPKTRLDLYNQLAAAQPNQWGNTEFGFGVRYCAGQKLATEHGEAHWNFEGESNTTELKACLAGTYLRYEKTDVANSLPKLIRSGFDITKFGKVDLTKYWEKQVVAGRASKEALIDLGIDGIEIKKRKTGHLKSINALISELEYAKLPLILDALKNDIMQRHEKVVVFTWQVAAAGYIVNALKANEGAFKVYGPATGELAYEKRLALAQEFAVVKDKAVIVCSRGGMGIALNDLRFAGAVVQVGLPWNPAECIQAESRVHREGNPHEEVESCYIVIPNTIDSFILEKLTHKANEAAKLASGDKCGVNLVSDITPEGQRGYDTLDDICRLLAELED